MGLMTENYNDISNRVSVLVHRITPLSSETPSPRPCLPPIRRDFKIYLNYHIRVEVLSDIEVDLMSPRVPVYLLGDTVSPYGDAMFCAKIQMHKGSSRGLRTQLGYTSH